MNTAAGESYQDRVRYYRRKAEQERAEKRRANWFGRDEREETTIDFEEALHNFKQSSGFDRAYAKAKKHSKRHAKEYLAFYRDDEQGYIGGVCAGIADKMKWDVTTVRIATVVLGLVFTLPTVLTYVGATMFLRKKNLAFHGRDERNFWKSASRRKPATPDVADAEFNSEENK